jgi:hypothetical protein
VEKRSRFRIPDFPCPLWKKMWITSGNHAKKFEVPLLSTGPGVWYISQVVYFVLDVQVRGCADTLASQFPRENTLKAAFHS